MTYFFLNTLNQFIFCIRNQIKITFFLNIEKSVFFVEMLERSIFQWDTKTP